jgi:hypothetical protein
MDMQRSVPSNAFDRYFIGRTRAWGTFHDRFGRLRRRFGADIEGRWDGDELTLDEDILFDDGETQRRIWRIRKLSNDAYEGRAGEVVGVARGALRDGVVLWRYDFLLPVGAASWRVRFDDCMVLHDEQVMVSRARVSKFGIAIGEMIMSFQRAA